MNLANEGLEARKKEEEVIAKKRKAEEEATWEGKWSCALPCSLNLMTARIQPGESKELEAGGHLLIRRTRRR